MDNSKTAVETAKGFVDQVDKIFLFPLIILLSSIAFLVFLYGCAEYIMNADNDTARETGKKHITFGLIGLVIMMSAYALLNLAVGTFGLSKQLDCANKPDQNGCDFIFYPNTGVGGSNPGGSGGTNPGGSGGTNPGGSGGGNP
ncbi:MAG TPA: hypothetical protein PKA42_03200 [Candidatus Paceibacterota bacterium]|nr:hypothetical protein [Candidatus Paceibacterota bacterium]HMO83148.1 hypothetical protein [Candidatus Paceibacterota bacterium]